LFKGRAVSSGEPIGLHVFGPDGGTSTGDDASFPSTSCLIDPLFGRHRDFTDLSDVSASGTFESTGMSDFLCVRRFAELVIA
jgi:hypothetical protein